MDEIIKLLEELNLDVDPAECDDLVDGGYLTSLDIVSLIAELSDRFDISIPAREIVPENFNSAEAIWDMVERLQDA
ncbi:MAG: acyl carrier protein [Oscillospiraceae bacterium]|nr:acyl carrier protein [Oscillospiraceae bacterium]